MTYYHDAFERAHDRLDDEIAALSDRAVRAEAKADRLRKALVRIGYPLAGAHPEDMRKIARDALDDVARPDRQLDPTRRVDIEPCDR